MVQRMPQQPRTLPAPAFRPHRARDADRLRSWLGCAALLLACFAVYAPALGGGFVWDDDLHLLDNPVLGENGLYRIWLTRPEKINYWPLTFTTYWIEHQLWGLDPLGYHVVNLLIHVANALLVWSILRRLGIPCAWLASLVFAVHPVNVESVAWIAQRKTLLSMFFFGLALLAYLRFEDRSRAGSYVLSLGCFAAAMLCKGAAVPLPAVLLLFAWWRRGAVTRRDVARALPFFAASALGSLVELASQDLVAADEPLRYGGFLTRLAGVGWIAWFYLLKALAPLDLCFVYPRWEIDASSPLAWLPLFAGLAVVGAAWHRRSGWGRAVLFALLYYGLMLSPVLGFFDIYYMRFSLVADHYQYLALPGIVALAVGGLGSQLAARGVPRQALVGGATCAVAFLAISSGLLCTSYRSAETLWRDTLAKNPDAFLAQYNLAHLLQAQGRVGEALYHYGEALRIEPAEPRTLTNLGRLFEDRGEEELAIDHYRRALAADAESLEARNNLAGLLEREGDLAGALAQYRMALRIAPDSAIVHYNLALFFERRGRLDQAIAHYRRALSADPEATPAGEAMARIRARGAPRQPGPTP